VTDIVKDWLGGSIWRAVAIVAGLQLAVLSYIVWTRVDILKNGREIVVDVVPVDPRDIFRGDYVILGYPFSTTGGIQGETDIALPEGSYENMPVYVTLKKEADGTWNRVAVADSYPADDGADQVVIKGRVDRVWPAGAGGGRQGRIRYGIESYFVPEGTGRELEDLVRHKRLRAVLAIASDGTAAIKALEQDGKRIHEQEVL
jgi:uncharacterized membrane-anchored protein